jgi:hypothetical protein
MALIQLTEFVVKPMTQGLIAAEERNMYFEVTGKLALFQ